MSQPNFTTTAAKTKPVRIKLPDMIAIPEGDYPIGTSDDQMAHLLRVEIWADEWYARDMFLVEQPYHLLHLPAFEIGRFPVTNAEYHQFVWATGYRRPRTWMGLHYREDEASHPVAGVSRPDVLAYCKWLNEQMAAMKMPVPPGTHYRLPNEAEWECASRGEDDRIYPWGNDFDPWRCNTSDSAKGGTTSVGTYSPSGDSPWGVEDMAGNVWEWTCSTLRSYPYEADDGRENLQSPDVCVIRGGAWYYSHKFARCSAREGVLPGYTSPSLGFRLCRTLP
jgi:formylglycine-generating enzyme required for sulfatase activity